MEIVNDVENSQDRKPTDDNRSTCNIKPKSERREKDSPLPSDNCKNVEDDDDDAGSQEMDNSEPEGKAPNCYYLRPLN